MKIGELAKIAHCRTVTIRYYEKIGLLPNDKRDGVNYRIYDDNDVEQLRFIKHCRNHKMPISDIKKLLNLRNNKECNCDEAIKIINTHIYNIKSQIDSLNNLINSLQNIMNNSINIKESGKQIIDILGKPCPACSDYNQKINNVR